MSYKLIQQKTGDIIRELSHFGDIKTRVLNSAGDVEFRVSQCSQI
jgi:hypothetical protein